MLISRPLIVDGKDWGAVYTFEKAGDVFLEHVHTENDNHITTLLFGGVRVTGDPKHDGIELYAASGGTIVNWVAGERHGFVALTDGATLLNMPKRRL